MARAKKKNGKKSKVQKGLEKAVAAGETARADEPEVTPREAERNALVLKQAPQVERDAAWDSFAEDMEAHSAGLKEVMNHSIRGALAMGAKIVSFSERPEIVLEIELANHDKKGQNWKPYNFVAKKLATVYSDLPSEKHMSDCARAYMKAAETGQLESGKTSMRELLGWKPSAVPALTGPSHADNMNPTLPRTKGEGGGGGGGGGGGDDTPVDPRAELITILHDSNESIQHWIDKCREQSKSLDIKDITENTAALLQTLETL